MASWPWPMVDVSFLFKQSTAEIATKLYTLLILVGASLEVYPDDSFS